MTCATMDRVTAPGYEPSEALLAALAEYEDSLARYRLATKALREATGAELKAHQGLTAVQLSGYLPWTSETVRVIAREAGVPRLKEPRKRRRKASS